MLQFKYNVDKSFMEVEMKNLIVEQWVEKYPYLREMEKNILFTTKEDVKKLENGEKIKVGQKDVSIEFLKKILGDEYYFEYASRYFTNKISGFCVSYIMEGDAIGGIFYDKATIIRGIDLLISTGQISLHGDELERYQILKIVFLSSFFCKNIKEISMIYQLMVLNIHSTLINLFL